MKIACLVIKLIEALSHMSYVLLPFHQVSGECSIVVSSALPDYSNWMYIKEMFHYVAQQGCNIIIELTYDYGCCCWSDSVMLDIHTI
jgi:hypothetical protein